MYKKSTPGLGVRVYLMLYNNSFEEAKYLADVRREKDAFERLIKERGVSHSSSLPYLSIQTRLVHADADTARPASERVQ